MIDGNFSNPFVIAIRHHAELHCRRLDTHPTSACAIKHTITPWNRPRLRRYRVCVPSNWTVLYSKKKKNVPIFLTTSSQLLTCHRLKIPSLDDELRCKTSISNMLYLCHLHPAQRVPKFKIDSYKIVNVSVRSGDIESNPGPPKQGRKPKYRCVMCECSVKNHNKAMDVIHGPTHPAHMYPTLRMNFIN